MFLIWQAVRAVTVEVMGVGAVVFMLFGAAGWTMESAGVPPEREADKAWRWIEGSTQRITTSLKPRLPEQARQQYVEHRLDYYGDRYRTVAGEYVQRVAADFEDFPRGSESIGFEPSAPAHPWLGTISAVRR